MFANDCPRTKLGNDIGQETDVDAILPRKGSITRATARRLQEDWARDAREGPRVLMSLRVDFGSMS